HRKRRLDGSAPAPKRIAWTPARSVGRAPAFAYARGSAGRALPAPGAGAGRQPPRTPEDQRPMAPRRDARPDGRGAPGDSGPLGDPSADETTRGRDAFAALSPPAPRGGARGPAPHGRARSLRRAPPEGRGRGHPPSRPRAGGRVGGSGACGA